MPGEHGYHNAKNFLDFVPTEYEEAPDGGWDVFDRPTRVRHYKVVADPDISRLDPRWPTHCACGFEFADYDHWQFFNEVLYLNKETGEELPINDFPPGWMWDQWWLHGHACYCGTDGKALAVVLPNRNHWHIDGIASNCTMPDDHVHKCWVRHGEPPNLTVDKNGHTCAAGGGSILSGSYHGFLQHGYLTDG